MAESRCDRGDPKQISASDPPQGYVAGSSSLPMLVWPKCARQARQTLDNGGGPPLFWEEPRWESKELGQWGQHLRKIDDKPQRLDQHRDSNADQRTDDDKKKVAQELAIDVGPGYQKGIIRD